MGLLFDDATIREIHDYNLALEARQEGMEKGVEKGIGAMVSTLQDLSMDRKTIAQTLAAKFDLLPGVAEEKVAQYWVP